MYYIYHKTPIGNIFIAGDGKVIKQMSFPEGSKQRRPQPDWQQTKQPFKRAIKQLDHYFQGKLKTFDLPLDPDGTEFQRQVWKALLDIPYGETTSYGELAQTIDRPKAARAVGAANGANPIPIVIPCHRVIGSTGALTGFGGGLPTKQWLLAHEQSHLPKSKRAAQQYQFDF